MAAYRESDPTLKWELNVNYEIRLYQSNDRYFISIETARKLKLISELEYENYLDTRIAFAEIDKDLVEYFKKIDIPISIINIELKDADDLGYIDLRENKNEKEMRSYLSADLKDNKLYNDNNKKDNVKEILIELKDLVKQLEDRINNKEDNKNNNGIYSMEEFDPTHNRK